MLGIYIFVPGTIVVSKVIFVNCTAKAASRVLADEKKWVKWWPESSSRFNSDSNYFIYKKDTFSIEPGFQHAIEIPIRNDGLKINSDITILALPSDSAAIQWECRFSAGINPLERIMLYQKATRINNNIVDILHSMASFLNEKENVYDYSFVIGSTKDTILIATKSISPVYPSTSYVYASINNLKKYIASEKANITGFPMLNVTKLSDTEFQIMVAIPIDKTLKEKGNIFSRRLVPGHFMITEVKGGDSTINNALNQARLYFEDYRKTSMAIPFQSLITDRIMEPDSSKWVTRIYCPVL